MKIANNIQEANLILQMYSGSDFKVESYHESLKRIKIRLSRPDFDEVVYVYGIGCESIHGRFAFHNASLSISQETINQADNEIETRIYDMAASFELITSGGYGVIQGNFRELIEFFNKSSE